MEQELIKKILEYNPNANIELINKAHDFAKKAHTRQKRASGEDFFLHPLEVAKILIDMKADSATICAGLLHDTVEDTKITPELLKQEFGDEIAELVEGVTKIGIMHFESKEDYNAENIRKVILATAKDIRVILIKLADRLHNMRTMKFLSEKTQKDNSRETLEIYAPIAYKLGMFKMKSELEDLSLRFLKPEVYTELKEKVAVKKEEREKEVTKAVEKIKNLLAEKGINAFVYGRAKHFFSIYKKMTAKHKKFEEIYDLVAVRIITSTTEECYRILGLIHSNWSPIPNGFHDYIATPKPNLYKSIHTEIVFEGTPIEIQIRTWDMHYMAEDGIAAHWRYKETERDKKFDKKIIWLKQILTWKRDSQNAKDFIESLKVDLFENEIVVFTPKGDPVTLPEGATSIDFAYQVHTEIGNQCSKAKVNGILIPLEHQLKSGDIVEIITSKNAVPSRNWLKFIKTNLAKTEIRQALSIKGIQHIEEEEDKSINIVRLIELEDKKIKEIPKISKCCNPKFGDAITAFFTKEKKITVHKLGCPNIATLDRTKKIGVRWLSQKPENIAKVNVTVEDRVGLLVEILNTIASHKLNVQEINTQTHKDNINIYLRIKYDSDEQLNNALMSIRSIRSIISVNHVKESYLSFLKSLISKNILRKR